MKKLASCYFVWHYKLSRKVTVNRMQSCYSFIVDLPHAFFRILSNKIYVILLLALTCEFNTMGYAVFIPKYLENQFRASPGLASVITGMVKKS